MNKQLSIDIFNQIRRPTMETHNLTLDPQYTPVLRLSDDQLEELVAERNNRSESDDVDWHDLY